MYQPEPSGSRRRSLVRHHSERRKRKESDVKLNRLSTPAVDQTTKERRSSSHANRKSPKPEFDDARLFCDECNEFYENICPYHKHTYVPDRKLSESKLNDDQLKADLTCPKGMTIKSSTIPKAGKGVFVTKQLEKNTYFGPYTGKRHTNFQSAQESGYAWSIADKNGKMVYIIDGCDPKSSNWLRYINCPNTIEQQNLIPVQYDRNMFYKTTRTIRPGEELFVYYGDEYARFLGIQPFEMDSMQIITGELTSCVVTSTENVLHLETKSDSADGHT